MNNIFSNIDNGVAEEEYLPNGVCYQDAVFRIPAENQVEELKQKLHLVCDILLRKDQMYDAWIEKNIGKEYVKR